MAQTVGDFFWSRLKEWGIRTIFGYPGDGINGLLGALNRAGNDFDFVQVRHEEMAAFMASLSGGLASMGAGVPYAIAAKFAHPDRPVIAMVGDGAMQMNNMAELITVAKYYHRWTNKTWICCVWNNEYLNQVTWEQRVMEGDPRFIVSQSIPNVPYHKFAELIGLKGMFVDDPRESGPRVGGSACLRGSGRRGGQNGSRSAPASTPYHAGAGEKIHLHAFEGLPRGGPASRGGRQVSSCLRTARWRLNGTV